MSGENRDCFAADSISKPTRIESGFQAQAVASAWSPEQCIRRTSQSELIATSDILPPLHFSVDNDASAQSSPREWPSKRSPSTISEKFGKQSPSAENAMRSVDAPIEDPVGSNRSEGPFQNELRRAVHDVRADLAKHPDADEKMELRNIVKQLHDAQHTESVADLDKILDRLRQLNDGGGTGGDNPPPHHGRGGGGDNPPPGGGGDNPPPGGGGDNPPPGGGGDNPPPGGGDGNFTTTYDTIAEMQDAAKNGMNFSNIRNLGTGVNWSAIEKSPGNYDFTQLNDWTSAAHALGKGYIFTIDDPPLDDCPGGGQMFGKFTDNGVPSESAYTDFLTNLSKDSAAQKAAGQGGIDYYELWNEASSKNFSGMTPEQLAQYTVNASETIRANDPTAKILAPSITGTGSAGSQEFYDQYLQALNSIHESDPSTPWPPFDALSFHFRTNNGQPFTDMTQDMNDMLSIVDKNGFGGVPWCDTEDGPQIGANLTQAQNADFTSEDLAQFYGFVNSHGLYNPSLPGYDEYQAGDVQGITSSSGAPNQAGDAWNLMTSWLQDGTIGALQQNGNTWEYPMTYADGSQGLIVFDSSGNGSFDVPPGYTQYTDSNGVMHTISAGESIPIGEGPILLT